MIVGVVLGVVAALAFGVLGAYVLFRAAVVYRARERPTRPAPVRWDAPESHIYRTDETYDNYCARAARNGLRPASYRNWLVVMSTGLPEGTMDRLMRENDDRVNR